MSKVMNLKTLRRLGLLLLPVCFLALPALAADSGMVAGHTPEEALRLGEAMYQRGVLPSGQPMRGTVQGDVEVSGQMTTCANCHRRSGMGSLEGGVITPPTNGARLFQSLQGQQDIPGSSMKRSMFRTPPRPAYADRSLADALRVGSAPNGRKLADTMPRYLLDDEAAAIMTFYLKSLSSEPSPGVSADQMRFATIVTDTTSRADRDALLLPLRAYLKEEWNDRLAVLGTALNARWTGPARAGTGRSYHQATLDVWELTGAPETWQAQLSAYYHKKPVFAVLGGIAPGSWGPIHDFCESNKIPCLFPITDLPVLSGSDWYTLYFSKGVYQEAESAAKYLSRVCDLPPGREVLQVFRETAQGSALSNGFAATWQKLGKSALKSRVLKDGEGTGPKFWQDLAAAHPNAVILAWLEPGDLTGLDAVAQGADKPTTIVVSGTILAGNYAALPDRIRDFTFLTYPNRLPGDQEYSRSLVKSWLKIKQIPVSNLEISAKVYLATRLLSNALLDMGVDCYRDYLMDLMDDSADQVHSSINYPLLSFGPGQRYAAKGCYLVTLTKGEHPKLVRQSEWVIY
jgi:ABC-type branched-subunit amino acid transport system substrate-binding protein